MQSRVSLIKLASATTGRWFCASRQKERDKNRKCEEELCNGFQSIPQDFRAQKELTPLFPTLMHKYRELSLSPIYTSPFARESPSKNIHRTHVRSLWCLSQMTNAEIPVFFYELEEGKVAGKEKASWTSWRLTSLALLSSSKKTGRGTSAFVSCERRPD